MKSSAVSSAMAGLIHPGIAYIALQQNTTASRMPASGICVRAAKTQACAPLCAKAICKMIIIHTLIAHKFDSGDSGMSWLRDLNAYRAPVAIVPAA
jgi:hypothetical protein